MAWGEHETWLKKIAVEDNRLPQALAEKPVVALHLISVWRAYLVLRTDRQVGFDHGPIMFTSIDRYAMRYGIEDNEQFDRFLTLIRAMDDCENNFKVAK